MLGRWISITLAAAFLALPAYGADKVGSTHATDEKIIREQARQYAKAFTVGDTRAIADMFSTDAVLLTADGNEYRGKTQIEKQYSDYFSALGGQPLQIVVQSVKFPAADVAIEEGLSRLTDTSPAPTLKYTAVHAKQNGKWRMVNVTESMDAPKSSGEYIKDLAWLVGDWSTGEGKNKLRMHAEWLPNKNFISFKHEAAGSASATDQQMIGWDPAARSITSWHFSPDGGIGRSRWFRQGDRWMIYAVAYQPDGSVGRATYLLRKNGNDDIAWRSVDRSLNGMRLPNTAEIRLTRNK